MNKGKRRIISAGIAGALLAASLPAMPAHAYVNRVTWVQPRESWGCGGKGFHVYSGPNATGTRVYIAKIGDGTKLRDHDSIRLANSTQVAFINGKYAGGGVINLDKKKYGRSIKVNTEDMTKWTDDSRCA